MKHVFAFMLLCLTAMTAFGQRQVSVTTSGAVIYPPNFISANGLATTTYAATVGPVMSVNGRTGTVALTADDVGAMPTTTSTLSLTGLTISGGVLTVSSPSTVSGGVLRLGPLTLTSAYTSGITRLTIPYCNLSISAWTVFNNDTTFYKALDVSTGGAVYIRAAATLSVSGAATFSRTPTISPSQWYAVFYLPQGLPITTFTTSIIPTTFTVSSGGTVSVPIKSSTLSQTFYTDVKLKGYEQSPAFASDTVDLKFRYVSYDPGYAVQPQVGTTRPNVYFTRSSGADARYWVKQDIIHPVSWYLSGPARVGGWVLVVTDNGAWFNPYNRNLVWAYALATSTGPETDTNGNTIWRPIAPVWTDRPIDLTTNP